MKIRKCNYCGVPLKFHEGVQTHCWALGQAKEVLNQIAKHPKNSPAFFKRLARSCLTFIDSQFGT